MTEPNRVPRALVEWEQLGDPPRIVFTSNINLVPAPAQNELQHLLDCARITIEAIDLVQTFSGKFAGAFLHIDPANNRRLELPELKREAKARAIASAFKDAVEVAHHPLEWARHLLALWEFKDKAWGPDFQPISEEDAADFHKLPLRTKLERLATQYGFKLKPELVEIVRSLAEARNCIVHRFGQVTSMDTRGAPALKVSWHELAIASLKVGADGPPTIRRLEPHLRFDAGERIAIMRRARIAEFPVGSQMSITTTDLSEICNTVHVFALEVRDELRRRAEALGIKTDQPPTDD